MGLLRRLFGTPTDEEWMAAIEEDFQREFEEFCRERYEEGCTQCSMTSTYELPSGTVIERSATCEDLKRMFES